MTRDRFPAGALLVTAAIVSASACHADAFGWNYSGSGLWGDTAKWTRNSGTGTHLLPSLPGDTISVPAVTTTGITLTMADAGGQAGTFTVGSITIVQVSQQRGLGNPAIGTSWLIFDNAGSDAFIAHSSNSNNNRMFGVADRVHVRLDSSLTLRHDSNLNSGFRLQGVIVSGPSLQTGLRVTGGSTRVTLANTNLYVGGTTVQGNNNRSGAGNVNRVILLAEGGATAVASSTGTGPVTVKGVHVGDDYAPARLCGSGTIGPLGRTGTTLTASGASVNARGEVAPANAVSLTGSYSDTIGTLTVNGSVMFGDHSDLMIEVNAMSADALKVNGQVDLSSSFDRLSVTAATGASLTAIAKSYELVHYTAGGLNGVFNTVTLPAALVSAGYRVLYNQPSSLGPAYASITIARPAGPTLLLIR